MHATAECPFTSSPYASPARSAGPPWIVPRMNTRCGEPASTSTKSRPTPCSSPSEETWKSLASLQWEGHGTCECYDKRLLESLPVQLHQFWSPRLQHLPVCNTQASHILCLLDLAYDSMCTPHSLQHTKACKYRSLTAAHVHSLLQKTCCKQSAAQPNANSLLRLQMTCCKQPAAEFLL